MRLRSCGALLRLWLQQIPFVYFSLELLCRSRLLAVLLFWSRLSLLHLLALTVRLTLLRRARLGLWITVLLLAVLLRITMLCRSRLRLRLLAVRLSLLLAVLLTLRGARELTLPGKLLRLLLLVLLGLISVLLRLLRALLTRAILRRTTLGLGTTATLAARLGLTTLPLVKPISRLGHNLLLNSKHFLHKV